METRKITIANTSEQSKKTIMSAATTLGELKRDMDASQINYEGMDFIEALTKTQLRGDDSVLPHNVHYKNTITNELVFLLTVPNRKIKSGSRSVVYDRINNRPNACELKEAIKNYFGRNYTMVPTSELEDFIYDWDHLHEQSNNESKQDSITIDQRVEVLEKTVKAQREAIMELVDILHYDYNVEDVISELDDTEDTGDSVIYSAGMTSQEIDDLVEDVLN